MTEVRARPGRKTNENGRAGKRSRRSAMADVRNAFRRENPIMAVKPAFTGFDVDRDGIPNAAGSEPAVRPLPGEAF